MKRILLTVSILIFLISVSNAAQYTILFGSFYFNPNSMTVNVGDTIVWSGSFTSHPLSSGSVPAGALPFFNGAGTSFSYVVTEPGNYDYFCQNHSSMTGAFTALGTSGINNLNVNALTPLIISDDDFIHIAIPDQLRSDFTIEVVSLLGSLIYSGELKFPKQDLYIDKRSMLPGVYFVRVEGQKKVYGKKIAITR